MIGFVTIRGSGHERWRTYAIGALVGAFIVEEYKVATAPVRIPQDGKGVFMVSLGFLCPLWTSRLCGCATGRALCVHSQSVPRD